jgi:rhodanese-related sulfurtransferase
VLYCNSDRRSSIAAEKLSKYTGKKARHLKGGFQAWREAQLPIRLY